MTESLLVGIHPTKIKLKLAKAASFYVKDTLHFKVERVKYHCSYGSVAQHAPLILLDNEGSIAQW